MERCPVCRAKFKEEPVCYRCGTDLAALLSIETQAEALEQRAVVLFGAGDLLEARHVARQVLQLKRSPLALVLSEFLTQELIAEELNTFKRLLR